MLPSLEFPMIIKNNNGIIYSKINIDVPYDEGSIEYVEYLTDLELNMDKYYKPLDIYVDSLKVHEIHYGDSGVISKLIWLPYLEIVFFTFFILIAFTGFQLIRKDEKNNYIYIMLVGCFLLICSNNRLGEVIWWC